MRHVGILSMLLGLGVLFCTCPVAQTDESAAGTRAFVELESTRSTAFVGEVVRVQIRIGFDAAWFAEHAVPLFRREMDVPLSLHVPWLRALPGAVLLPDPQLTDSRPASLPGRRFALGDEIVRGRLLADVERDGRRYTVLGRTYRLMPERAGNLQLAGVTLRFASATRFEAGFLDERIPVDRTLTTIEGTPLSLDVAPLPRSGRPAGFHGAIGTFRVEATAEPRGLEAGATLHVRLSIEGEGNLERLRVPTAAAFPGFHVYGTIDDRRGPPRRTVTYELAPLTSRVASVPALALSFFDPVPPGTYRVVRTAPIPVRVRPHAAVQTPHAPESPPPGPAPSPPSPAPVDMPRSIPSLLGALVLFGTVVALGAVVLLAFRRRRASAHRAAAVATGSVTTLRATASRATARRDVLSALPSGGEPLERAFVAYLAACLHVSRASIVAPDLAARLSRAGLDPELAARAARALDGLLAARYGGPPDAGRGVDRDLLDAVERDCCPVIGSGG